jgi:flagellar motor protein MotB
MTPARAPRWALSFADLCLVLLAFFVMLQARSGDRAKVAQSMRAAFGNDARVSDGSTYEARLLFEPGEAVLKPAARARFEALGGRAAATGQSIRIVGEGMDPAGRRFDGWELAAARTAAIARALRAGGLREERIEVVIPEMAGRAMGQRISINTIH